MLPGPASATLSPTTTSLCLNNSAKAQTTFEKSLEKFKKKLASQRREHAWIDDCQATRLQDVVDEAAKAQAHYYHRKGDSELYKRITSFSKRVGYYGKVLDVMVQHHPEYVSLAWGSLKFIFGVVVEHERLASTVVTALSDIADALSPIDLAEILYPTNKMKDTIVTLNCDIMEFLCRAMDWYKSNSFSRAIQSITRPAALRYDDLIENIEKTRAKITDLSVAGSQAEQRDMHQEMRQEHHAEQGFRSIVQNRLNEMQHQLNTLIQQKYSDGDLKTVYSKLHEITTLVHHLSSKQASSEQTLLQQLVVTKQDIQSTQAVIRHQLSEVQLNQAISFMATKCSIEHKVAYEHAFLLRKVHRVTSRKCTPFWDSQQLHTWDQATSHSSIIVMSTFRDRLNIRDFYVGVIEQLLQSQISVFWIIEEKKKKGQKHNIFDVLKSLIAQALSKLPSTQTDVGMSFGIRALDAVTSISDYTSLLADTLSQLKLGYIIVDANAISSESIEDCCEVFRSVLRLLGERKQDTVIKTMFLGHGFSRDVSVVDRPQQAVVRVGETSKRKGRRVPQAPLKSKARNFPAMR